MMGAFTKKRRAVTIFDIISLLMVTADTRRLDAPRREPRFVLLAENAIDAIY